MKITEKMTPQVRSRIREQLLDDLKPYGINPDDWACSIQDVRYGAAGVTAEVLLHHKRLEGEIWVDGIYFNDKGDILQRNRFALL